MKKILTLCCITALHSCSSSDDLNVINSTNEKTTTQSRAINEYSLEYAETIFPKYFSSIEYSNTTNEIQLFYSKFKNNELAKSLKTKTNLAATKFSSKEVAVQILVELKHFKK